MLTDKGKEIDVTKIKNGPDILGIIDFYDNGEITKDELMLIWFMSLTVSRSEGHTSGFNSAKNLSITSKIKNMTIEEHGDIRKITHKIVDLVNEQQDSCGMISRDDMLIKVDKLIIDAKKNVKTK